MRDVYVAGVGMTRFGKQIGRSLRDLSGEAASLTLKGANIRAEDVQATFFGNAAAGSITGQEMLAGQFGLRGTGLRGIPIVNVENACASGSTAFHLAWQAVAAGLYDAVLAVGAEKMAHPDKARSFAAISGAIDVELLQGPVPSERSFLLDLYAETAKRYLEETDATREDFAMVAIKNHRNGMANPWAQYGSVLTVQDVLTARQVVWPYTLQMCSPISDGAAAALLVSEDVVGAAEPRVVVRGSALRSATSDVRVTVATAAAAYEMAGLGPEALNCVELHDATASAELLCYEDLGLASRGDGVSLVRSHATSQGGRLPVNTSGGLLARGHPMGATGLAQIAEIVLQLQGRAGPRQVPEAEIGLAENAGGFDGDDNVACVVNVFQRVGRRLSRVS